MPHQNNIYDFSHRSKSVKPGFECFKKEKEFYFHFNDKNGDALLFSQPYKSEKSRENGIRSVIANAPLNERIIREKGEKGQSFFILKAGNKTEIARSRSFNDLLEMEEMINTLASINENTPIFVTESEGGEINQEKAGGVVVKQEEKTPIIFEPLPKYSFRINYYPDSNSGKIEDIVSGKSRNFEGLGGEMILDFISSTLPMKTKKERLEPSAKVALKPAPTASIEEPYEEIKDITFKVGNQIQRAGNIGEHERFTLEIGAKTIVTANQWPVSVTVEAKAITTIHKLVLFKRSYSMIQEDKISIPIISNPLQPGLYRLMVKFEWSSNKAPAVGSTLMNVKYDRYPAKISVAKPIRSFAHS
jgi:uncharacterized protein YegP (UPF0339 family)